MKRFSATMCGSLFASAVILTIMLLTSCATKFGKAVQKWEIQHQAQIQQTAFLIAQDVGQAAMRAYAGGLDQSGKFNFASALRSIEGNYTNPQQVKDLLNTWGLQNPALANSVSVIAADLADHPPKNQAEAMAKLEGYIAGIAPAMGVTPPKQQ